LNISIGEKNYDKYSFDIPKDILELETHPILRSILNIKMFHEVYHKEPRIQNFKFFIQSEDKIYYTSDIQQKIAQNNSK